jgi:hypothetical protein
MNAQGVRRGEKEERSDLVKSKKRFDLDRAIPDSEYDSDSAPDSPRRAIDRWELGHDSRFLHFRSRLCQFSLRKPPLRLDLDFDDWLHRLGELERRGSWHHGR